MCARTVTALVALALLFAAPLSAEPVRIGVIADGPWSRNAEILGIFQAEIEALTSGEFEVTYPGDLYKVGDWTAATARAHLDALLGDPACDIVLALGAIASSQASHLERIPKPVVAPFIIDADLQGMPVEDGSSGVENFAWITSPFNLPRDLEVFYEVHAFEHLTVLSTSSLLEAIPELVTKLDEAAGPLGVRVTYVPVADDAEAALAQIPETADARLSHGTDTTARGPVAEDHRRRQ